MSLTLNLNYLIRQLKFVFLFVLWAYCALRIFDNTFSTAWISFTEDFYHPQGLTKWWYYIQMMPVWWVMHLIIIIYLPLLMNRDFRLLLQIRKYKLMNYFFWFLLAPISLIII